MKPNLGIFSAFSPLLGIALLTTVSLRPAAAADDYVGAGAVLRKIAEQSAKPEAKPEKTDERSKLRADLAALAEAQSGLTAAESAKRWLELVDRAAKLPPPNPMEFNSVIMPLSSDDLMAALPPPAAWAELAKDIAARPAAKGADQLRETGLQLLAATLAGDKDGRQRAIAALQAKAATGDESTAFVYKNMLDEISQATLAMSDDPDAVLKSLERQLASTRTPARFGGGQIRVPNLVSIAGAAKAEAFLRRALVQRNVTLEFNVPNETSRLAQKLALELMDKLGSPQWGLVNSLDATALYEAMDKRFGKNDAADATDTNATADVNAPGDAFPDNFTGDNSKVSAQVYYFLGLISEGRNKDAVAIAKKMGRQGQMYMPEEAFKAMERAGQTVALDNFFFELLSQDPGLPFWDQYVALAAKAGQTDRMLKLAHSAAANPDLTKAKKAAINECLFRILLAGDEVEEGVQELRRLIASDDPAQTRNGQNAGQLGVMLARVGQLLEKPEWTAEGVAAAENWLKQESGRNQNPWELPSVAQSLTIILIELKRGPEAEAVLTDCLASMARPAANRQEFFGGGAGSAAQLLTELALLYSKAGRPADVIALLEQAPYWGVKDLDELMDVKPDENPVALMWMHTPNPTQSLPAIAANALAASGRKDEALKITEALLNHDPGLDRGYELLLSLDGSNVIARLDEQFARDQFEERPLIWKAHVLRQQGKLEEAEKIARQAIAIDPSDGEEGPGDRMRAYSELADIREARGSAKDAEFFRQAVTAIRLSEQADQFYMAGLLKRAIKMYEDSLTHFADAYCIQSRLAIQMSALGMNEQAEQHYRRAYELMPDSFGRVESHCFGCERAFDGERAQDIAEKVFTKIAAERPDKPQVHYLLGYLREEQEKFNAASTNYFTAVTLDPDYLNAWIRIQGISENILLPASRRDDVAFNILRLDPMQRHGGAEFTQVSNLAGLWQVVEAAAKRRPPKTPALLTLTASQAALEKKQNDPASSMERMQIMEEMRSNRQNLTPARAVGQTVFVRVAGQLISNENSRDD